MDKSEIRSLLFQLDRARRRLMQPYFTALGLPLGQGQPRILTRLLEGDGLTQRALAQACGLDAATLSRALDRLEEAGLIARESHPDSRRAYLVRLTEAGRDKAEAVRSGFKAVEDSLCRGFSDRELEDLGEDLRRLLTNLEGCEGLEL